MATPLQEANERVSEFEQAVVEAIAEIDQTDSNRVALQETLDSVRETLANCYGDTLTDDVNEHLGIETIGGEIDDDDDE